MNEVDVLTNLETGSFDSRTHKLVDSARGNSAFDDYSSSLGANLHYFLDCSNYIASINLF